MALGPRRHPARRGTCGSYCRGVRERPRAPSRRHPRRRAERSFLTALLRNSWWAVPMLLTFLIFVAIVFLIVGDGLSLYLNDPT